MVNNIQDFGRRLSLIESNITSHSDRLGELEASVNDLGNKMSSDDEVKDFRQVPRDGNGKIFVKILINRINNT